MGVRAWLIGGLAACAAALALALSGAPSVVAGTNAVRLEAKFATSAGPAIVCQADETLPARTSAIRLSLEAVVGPSVTLDVYAGGRPMTHGRGGSGWTGRGVTA